MEVGPHTQGTRRVAAAAAWRHAHGKSHRRPRAAPGVDRPDPARLADRLHKEIARSGPMPFDQWMTTCLYDPVDGYYMRRGRKTGPGTDADFATGPTLHQFLGVAVAREAQAFFAACPGDPTVVEFGGGEGDLARAALAHLDAHAPSLARKLRWLHLETSPAHRAAQAAGADERMGWVEEMPHAECAFVVANEFLDALPVAWLEMAQDGWHQLAVGVQDGAFVPILGPPATRAELPEAEVGERLVVHDRGAPWFKVITQRAQRVRILLIDYGDRWPARDVRGYRTHGHTDPFGAPGNTDITANVDFAQTRAWAAAAGLGELSYETQEAFLLRHGVLDALNAIDRSTVEGASSYLRLRQLLLPTGMGAAFKVQLLG